jgi:hypothetical protein
MVSSPHDTMFKLHPEQPPSVADHDVNYALCPLCQFALIKQAGHDPTHHSDEDSLSQQPKKYR